MKLLSALLTLITIAACQTASGQTLDANGWTVLTPSADSRVIYVSNSGLDTNDGLSPATPKKNIVAARTLMRTGMPDWMQLKCGDVFVESVDWRYSGSAPGRECVLTSYGTGPRPIIRNNNAWYFHRNENHFHDFAMVGIELDGFIGAQNTSGVGIQILGSTTANLTFEDNVIRNFATNVAFTRFVGTTSLQGILFRRNHVLNGYNFGVGTGFCDGFVMEENVIDLNGWIRADVFYQGAYLVSSSNMTIRNNVFSRSGNFGLKISGDTVSSCVNNAVTDNLFYKSGFGVGHAAGPNGYNASVDFAHQNLTFSNNVIVNPGRVLTGGTQQRLFAILHNIDGVQANDNVFLDNNEYLYAGQYGGETFRFNSGERIRNVTMQRNITHNWPPQNTGDHLYQEEIVENLVQVGDYPPGVTYVDNARNIASYNASIGGAADTVAFVESAIATQRRGAWDAKYTAKAVNDYIRAGFTASTPIPDPTPDPDPVPDPTPAPVPAIDKLLNGLRAAAAAFIEGSQ